MKRFIKSICTLSVFLIASLFVFSACGTSSANKSKFDSIKGDKIESEKSWDIAFNNLDAIIEKNNFTMYFGREMYSENSAIYIDSTIKRNGKDMYIKASMKTLGAVKSETTLELYSSEKYYYFKDASDKWVKVDLDTDIFSSSDASTYVGESLATLMMPNVSHTGLRYLYNLGGDETIEYKDSEKGYYSEVKISDTTYNSYVFKIKNDFLQAYSCVYEVSGKEATKTVLTVVYDDIEKTKIDFPI